MAFFVVKFNCRFHVQVWANYYTVSLQPARLLIRPTGLEEIRSMIIIMKVIRVIKIKSSTQLKIVNTCGLVDRDRRWYGWSSASWLETSRGYSDTHPSATAVFRSGSVFCDWVAFVQTNSHRIPDSHFCWTTQRQSSFQCRNKPLWNKSIKCVTLPWQIVVVFFKSEFRPHRKDNLQLEQISHTDISFVSITPRTTPNLSHLYLEMETVTLWKKNFRIMAQWFWLSVQTWLGFFFKMRL